MGWRHVKDAKLENLSIKQGSDSLRIETTTEITLTQELTVDGSKCIVTSLGISKDARSDANGKYDVYRAICMPIKEVKKGDTK